MLLLAVTQVATNLCEIRAPYLLNRLLSHNEPNERSVSGPFAVDLRRLPFLTTLSNINAAL